MPTIVYWDTCAYRDIISKKYKRPKTASSIQAFASYISSLEKQKGYISPPCALVLWELIAHLPDIDAIPTNIENEQEWEKDFKSCFHACKFVKHQSFVSNGSHYTPFPQSELACGIDSVHSGAMKQKEVCQYVIAAHRICTFVANFEEAIADRCLWRRKSELVGVAMDMINFKNDYNQIISESLIAIKNEPTISEEDFIDSMINTYFSILYHCVYDQYIPKGDELRYMHSASYSFIRGWAQKLYTKINQLENIERWAKENKISNTFIDALLLAIFSDHEEETNYIFVTRDKSILYENRGLNDCSHRIISLKEHLQDIGFYQT